MSYSCKILLDSISETGKRLTTMEITFPRIVLAEFNTHRMFSRNSASSRAIPFKKQIERVESNPFIPEKFPINGKGMQPNAYLNSGEIGYDLIKKNWMIARDSALVSAEVLYNSLKDIDFYSELYDEDIFVHKQIVNRLLEPFMWHTVIITATEWDNFFKLRCDENAQYEIRRVADLMYEAYHVFDKTTSTNCDVNNITNGEWFATRPQKLKVGEWHCPLVSEEDNQLLANYLVINNTKIKEEFGYPKQIGGADYEVAFRELKKRISVARCARVSYLTHDGKRNIEADLNLYERLLISGHMSPFEHCATPYFSDISIPLIRHTGIFEKNDLGIPTQDGKYVDKRSGNFIGWMQLRKFIKDENCTYFRK